MVNHLPRHSNVKGLSAVAGMGGGGENCYKQAQQVSYYIHLIAKTNGNLR